MDYSLGIWDYGIIAWALWDYLGLLPGHDEHDEARLVHTFKTTQRRWHSNSRLKGSHEKNIVSHFA